MSPARTPRPPALRYRPARRTDVETLAELGMLAYRVASLEQRREFYTDHPRFTLRDVRVGELDGRVVASLVLYPLTAWVRAARVPITGVGSVAVSPEHRRRGIAESMIRAMLRELRQRGSGLSGLYAFRGAFYRKFGWGVIEVVHALRVSPSNLPASDETRWVRRLMLPDRAAVQALYERVAQQQGHFALERRNEWWQRRLWTYAGDWVVYEGRRRGQIEGYLHYEVDASNGPFKLAISVKELVAGSPGAFRGLAGYLGTLADQASEIEWLAPADNAWLTTLRTAQALPVAEDLGVFSDTGAIADGLMLRVVDVKAGLEALPPQNGARGEVILDIDDDVLPANARAWRVIAREGKLAVSPETGRRGRAPRLSIPADMLGPIVAGTVPATRAAETGLIESAGGAAELVEPWFRGRAPFLHPMNGF